MAKMMRDVVQIQGEFKPSVQLPGDFLNKENNRHFIETYIPTEEILDIFMRVRESLQPQSDNRAKLFTGTYGTGKSDLMLMIANYVTRSSDDPLLAPFFERLRALNSTKAEMIYDARLGKPPFLLILLQADTASTFSSFVMDGLEEALEQSGQRNILGATYYSAARDLISFWEARHPNNIERLEKELQESHMMTLIQLKHDLAGLHADQALKIFSEVTAKAIGMPFHPTAVIERPYEAFEVVAKALVEKGLCSGIFVIADEFTHLLKKLAEGTTASPDVKAIDNLAEWAARSGKHQTHFYVVSLEGFSSVSASTRTSQTALERTGGRFIRGQEELRSQHMEELISASIAKKTSPKTLFIGVQGQRDELLSIAMRLWGNRPTGHYNREWQQKTVVEGCFPLHPLAAYCLSLLNKQLAQNERTMFNFIWDEKHGLKYFIEQEDLTTGNGWLNLLSLDRLFSYFETNIKERRYDLYHLYEGAQSKLSPKDVDSGLEGRLLRALILLEMASGDSNLRTDRDLLRHALALPPVRMQEFQAALSRLEQEGIAYLTQAGYYQLLKQGQPNPRELCSIIERSAKDLVISPIARLNEDYKPSDVLASDYNKLHGTERKLIASFVSVNDLVTPVALTEQLQKVDGKIWYVVPHNEEERLQARSVAEQLTKQHSQLVIAIPFVPIDIIKSLKHKISLEGLRRNSEYSRPDYQAFLAEDGIVGRDYYSAFSQARREFNSSVNFEWYINGQTLQVAKQLGELASQVMKTVFPATPPHQTAQHLAKGSKSGSKLKEPLDQILNAPFKRSSKKSATQSPTDAILLQGAKVLGLIYLIEQDGGYDTYDVCVPDSGRYRESSVIWDLLDKRLSNTSVSLSEIIGELGQAPYGLSPQVTELFLATFFRFNKDFVEVYTTKNGFSWKTDITSEIVISIVDTPKDYVVQYKPLLELQKEFLCGVERIILSRTNLRSPIDKTASLRNRVAKILRQSVQGVSVISQQPSLKELVEVLPGIPQETLEISIRLIKIGQLTDEVSIATQLLNDLPQCVGLAIDSTKWTSPELQQALSGVGSAYNALRKIPKCFRHLVVKNIGECFGISELSQNEDEIWRAAQRWRQEQVVPVQVRDLDGKKDIQNLLILLDNPSYSFEYVFLNALPNRWGLRTFEEWPSVDTRGRYLERLEKAKLTIEDLAQKKSMAVDKGTVEKPSTSVVSRGDGQVATSTNAVKSSSQAVEVTADKKTATSKAASQPIHVAETNSSSNNSSKVAVSPKTEYRSQGNESDAVGKTKEDSDTAIIEQAFNRVKSIFNGLPPRDRQKLYDLLVREYGDQ